MIEDFKKAYGYDPVPYMPVFNGVTVVSPDVSDRFLWDVRRLIADQISYNYVGGLREVSNEHGLTTWLENYGHWGFPGEFLQYGGQSDEIGGEFWSFGDWATSKTVPHPAVATSTARRKGGRNRSPAEGPTLPSIPGR